MRRLFLEAISLTTPRGRLCIIAVITGLVFLVPYSWLNNLSLWQALGWESAPSIGLTRAYWLLIHGDPIAAWNRNPLIYAVLPVVGAIIAKDIATLLAKRKRDIDHQHPQTVDI